jgi:hypothetical protein
MPGPVFPFEIVISEILIALRGFYLFILLPELP